MRYSILGTTGVHVSVICLGTAVFGVAPLANEAVRLVDEAIDLGINFIDTSNVYGNTPVFDRPGVPPAAERESAEEIVGKAIAGKRDQLIIATKSQVHIGPGINDGGLSRRHIIQQVDQSLRRLGTDYIDLYYAHNPDPNTALEETLGVYADLIQQGKLRYVGLSNHPAWKVVQALWIADRRNHPGLAAVQEKYSLLDRHAEADLAPACDHFGLSLIPYAPLHGGLLASLAVLDRPIKGDERFSGEGFTEREIAIAREVHRLSQEWGLEMYQASLAWLLSRPAVTAVIVGAENVDELRRNASAADVDLDDDQLSALTALVS